MGGLDYYVIMWCRCIENVKKLRLCSFLWGVVLLRLIKFNGVMLNKFF